MIGKIKDTLTVKYLCVKERVKSHFVNLWKRGTEWELWKLS